MSDPGEFVVGVDIGSSSVAAVAIDRRGVVVATSRSTYPGDHDMATGESEPTHWLTATFAAIAQIEAEGVMRAICVGGHGPTTVALSGEYAITFRHPAGQGGTAFEQNEAQAIALREMLSEDSPPRQLWDWVLSRMGGSSSTLGHWPGSPVLEGFGEPVPVGSPVGKTSGIPGIPDGIVLASGSNDGYTTSWGSGIDAPGKAFDPGGRTGGLGVAVATGVDTEFSRYGMPSAVPGVYVVGGPVAAHGAMLDWWSTITGRPVTELLALAEEVPPGSRGVMVLPYLEGERAPRWNPDLRAEILGLHTSTDVSTVARALLEGTAYGLGHLQKSLESRGVHMERLVSSGGPSRSRLWAKIKADVLQVPVDIPTCSEMASYGNALGAGAAIDWWPRPGEGSSGAWPTPEMATIEPEPNEEYRAGLARFIELGNEAEERLNNARSTQ